MSATGITALVNIVPSNIRAQMVAYYYMTISLAGLFLGPTMVGYIVTTILRQTHYVMQCPLSL